jgi:hypothetical protein
LEGGIHTWLFNEPLIGLFCHEGVVAIAFILLFIVAILVVRLRSTEGL